MTHASRRARRGTRATSRDLPTPAGPSTVNRWQRCSRTARSNACCSCSSSGRRPTSGVSSRRAIGAACRSTSSRRNASTGSPCPSRRPHRLDTDGVAHESLCLAADQHLAGRRRLLEPRRDVHRVAGDERVALAGDHLAGVDADPRLQPERGDGGAHLPGGPHRAQGVVLVGDRDAEHGHDGVADELLDRAAVPLEDRPHLVVVAAHRRPQRLGVGDVAERGRAGQVAEDDGHGLAQLAQRLRPSASGAPQFPQNLNPPGSRWPQEAHRIRLESTLLAMSGDPWLELAENANTYTPLGPKDERIVTDRYVLWMGAGDEPGWNVAQRFRFEPDELDEVRAEIHAHVRARGRTACSWEVGTHATAAGSRRPAATRSGSSTTSRRRSRSGWCSRSRLRRRRADVEVRRVRDRRRVLRGGADRGDRVRGAGAVRGGRYVPDPNNVVYLASVDGKPVARALGRVRRARRDAVRRLDAAGGARPRRLPCARRGALGGCGRARHAGARHAGRPDVAPDPRPARVPRGVRDPDPRRPVRQNARVRVPRRPTTRSARRSSWRRPATGR